MKACMQIVAYLRDHKTLGLRLVSNGGLMYEPQMRITKEIQMIVNAWLRTQSSG